jgi:outer membrane immunogenic protein
VLRLATITTVALAAVSANASDLGVVNVPEPEGYISPEWSQFYAGIFGGYGGGTYEYVGTAGAGFPWIGNGTGALLGVQAGADYQMGNLVLGGVVDLAWSNLSANTNGGGATITSTLQYLGTVRARAGVAVDTALLYAHGGLAFGRTETSAADAVGPIPFNDNDRLGYTVGAGVEVKMTDQISVFGEYAFTDLGNPIVFSNPPAGVPFDLNESLRFHSVKVGLNYRF